MVREEQGGCCKMQQTPFYFVFVIQTLPQPMETVMRDSPLFAKRRPLSFLKFLVWFFL